MSASEEATLAQCGLGNGSCKNTAVRSSLPSGIERDLQSCATLSVSRIKVQNVPAWTFAVEAGLPEACSCDLALDCHGRPLCKCEASGPMSCSHYL